jgi:competence protein ComEA
LLCIALAAGVAWFRAGISPASPQQNADATSIPSSSSSSTTVAVTSTTAATVVVDVAGAVNTPGVVTLAGGARVVDAIDAAGGAVAGADLSRLNLASVLVDGARVAVPMLGQPPPAIDPTAVTGGSSGSAPGSTAGSMAGTASTEPQPLVNVNTAAPDELESLPGVGPATAAAIVREREANGPFESVDDLDRVRGIGPAKLEQLRDLVTV